MTKASTAGLACPCPAGAAGRVVAVSASSELTPMEAGELTKMVQAFAKVIETADLEERINRLEGMATK